MVKNKKKTDTLTLIQLDSPLTLTVITKSKKPLSYGHILSLL